MNYLDHGSSFPNISKLEARSVLHGIFDTKAVYLTGNIPYPYALFCIWDKPHNGYAPAHITGWSEEEITYYAEQFAWEKAESTDSIHSHTEKGQTHYEGDQI